MLPLVTLTTDFGASDPYVASMKGVILRRCSNATIVDLSNDLPAQDVMFAALFIDEATRWFPEGTIHCVVVDPGVGTSRLPIIVRTSGQFFVCPDNGLLTFIARRCPIEEARIITNPQFMLERISTTFHGRDIFAPAAAALAGGAPLSDAGELVHTLTMLEAPEPEADESSGGLRGMVTRIDRFGNAITNISVSALPSRFGIRFNNIEVLGVRDTYGDVPPGQPVVLIGSSGYLEIAVHRGNAAELLGLRRGTRVETWQTT